MDKDTALAIAAGKRRPADAAEFHEAWQWLVNSGSVWGLEEWYGRMAAAMIDAGTIKPQGYWRIDEH